MYSANSNRVIKSSFSYRCISRSASLTVTGQQLERKVKTGFEMAKCGSSCGPGYATPLEAMKKGPREKVLYVICIQTDKTNGNDFLATVDVDPTSQTYCKIIARTYATTNGDELHHSGWNICSSCHGDTTVPKRTKLICPGLQGNLHIFDTSDERKPVHYKMVPKEEFQKFNTSFPHTTHCHPNGSIMISTMGDKDGRAKCEFVILDSITFEIKGVWTRGEKVPKFGYDFWYQPHYNALISSEWGEPNSFKIGFIPEDAKNPNLYGNSINFFNYETGCLEQSIYLKNGTAPLEVRFVHDPYKKYGFVGCGIGSTVHYFCLEGDESDKKGKKERKWVTDEVINIPAIPVNGWDKGTSLNALITDIILSLDDNFMCLSTWGHGSVNCYDISNPTKPKLVGQVYIGGITALEGVTVAEHNIPNVPISKVPPVVIRGKTLQGAPQMLQWSLDGKRLYVSSSLFSPWDKQFYPKMVKEGGWIVRINFDKDKKEFKLDPDFLVDFGGDGVNHPCLPHEMRYPGGDCTSDIWLPKKKC